jgi:hypothetical protein
MQGIYSYIPETNCVPREYSVAAILLFLFIIIIIIIVVIVFVVHMPLLERTDTQKWLIFS